MAVLEVNNLKKHFGSTDVLKGVSFSLEKGQVLAIIGPSGSGKSTFLRCLNLLEEPSEGTIHFEGVDITDPKTDINMQENLPEWGQIFGSKAESQL